MCEKAQLYSCQRAPGGWPLHSFTLYNLWEEKMRPLGSTDRQGRSGCFHCDDGFWKEGREGMFCSEHELCLKWILLFFFFNGENGRIFSLNKEAFKW